MLFRSELERATQLIKYLNDLREEGSKWKDQNTPPFPKIKHQIIAIDGLSNLLVSGLIDNNSMELKKGHYAHENALTSVVPNRNAIFAAITYAVALSIVKKTGEQCKIVLGTHMGDFDNNKRYPLIAQIIWPSSEAYFKVRMGFHEQ